MEVLSIRQPHAWAIIAGIKPVENRSRPFSYRGPLLIHASRKLAATPLRTIEHRFGISIPERELYLGGIIGIVELVECVTEHASPWFEGPFGLVLSHPHALPFTPMLGRLSLFSAPESLPLSLSAAAPTAARHAL